MSEELKFDVDPWLAKVTIKRLNQEIDVDLIECRMALEGLRGDPNRETKPDERAPKWVTGFAAWFQQNYGVQLLTSEVSMITANIEILYQKLKKKYLEESKLPIGSESTPSPSANDKSISSTTNSPASTPNTSYANAE